MMKTKTSNRPGTPGPNHVPSAWRHGPKRSRRRKADVSLKRGAGSGAGAEGRREKALGIIRKTGWAYLQPVFQSSNYGVPITPLVCVGSGSREPVSGPGRSRTGC
jgi:hypothetical protein